MNLTQEIQESATRGRNVLLPGMTFMVERMQALVNEFRELTAQAATVRELRTAAAGKRPAPVTRKGWSEDPAERKAEMRRRRKVAARNARRAAA